MKLTFEKFPGAIFRVDGNRSWNVTHAQVPVVLPLNDDLLRIYYSSRDAYNISRISFFDTNRQNPEQIHYVSSEPILEPGPLGSFDDSGVMPTCVLRVEDQIWLYYIGWTTRVSVPYQNSVGLAVSKDGTNFERKVQGPVLGTSPYDPYLVGTAWVERTIDGWFRALYLSCVGWQIINGKPEPSYNLKVANSADGIDWSRSGEVALGLDERDEAIASATAFQHKGKWFLLYSSRKLDGYREEPAQSYSVRLATSLNGENWTKEDRNRFIPAGRVGEWDSVMQAYPYALQEKESVLIFYNGNGFGQTGIGFGRVLL